MFSIIADISINLRTASNVARFSFIVQDSLSYLDLQVCKTSIFPDYFPSFCDDCKSKPLTSFVNTEEKCQKFFAPLRKLLYTLHLDLPEGRESSLKDDALKSVFFPFRCCTGPIISEIAIDYGFYARNLSNFIEDALIVNVPKREILKWVVKASFQDDPILTRLEIRTASKFIDCFYPVMTDSALFEIFLKQFHIYMWMGEFEEPEILEFLLYHSRPFSGNIYLDETFSVDHLSHCILSQGYLSIKPILKYISDSEPSSHDLGEYLSNIKLKRPRLTYDVIEKAEESNTYERIGRMAQIIWIFMDTQSSDLSSGRQEAGSEALRLIWSSIPDACVTFEELRDVFEVAFSEEELMNVFDFYVSAIGEFHDCVEPRSLRHICRTFLRRTFQKSDLWIPEAISRTGLPKSLQSFLNLEKKICR